jgi:ABC-type arginine transport system ATPase subunit
MVTHDQSLAKRVSRMVYLVDGEIVDEKIGSALFNGGKPAGIAA